MAARIFSERGVMQFEAERLVPQDASLECGVL
jgi:hypothetical protein